MIQVLIDQGWGRRSEQTDGTFYSDTYITEYKMDLLKCFLEGKNVSFRKMNAAMMQYELKKKISAFVSNPGKMDIKKYFLCFVAKDKKAP